jgi:hypothetical protein
MIPAIPDTLSKLILAIIYFLLDILFLQLNQNIKNTQQTLKKTNPK